MKECNRCGFNDEDCGCTCISSDKWYACPIENKKPENIQALKDYADFTQKEMVTNEYRSTEKSKQ